MDGDSHRRLGHKEREKKVVQMRWRCRYGSRRREEEGYAKPNRDAVEVLRKIGT